MFDEVLLFYKDMLSFIFFIFFIVVEKELSLCHKLWFSNHHIFGFQRRKPLTFQTMTSVRSNYISLKYLICTKLGSKDIRIINSEFVAKTQFLYTKIIYSTSPTHTEHVSLSVSRDHYTSLPLLQVLITS